MYYVYRNNQQLGLYTTDILGNYVRNGKILKQERTWLVSDPKNVKTVGYFLKPNSKRIKKYQENIFHQLYDIFRKLIVPSDAFSWQEIRADSRLQLLAVPGLALAPAPVFRFLSVTYILCYFALFFHYLWIPVDVSRRYLIDELRKAKCK
ncbi:MAG: hypothetical protein LBR52_00695 [Prevotellaceae bacterium]|jgi:hypothetical protein|nr:hypothetical protein [Prevotellaceae bacterium]